MYFGLPQITKFKAKITIKKEKKETLSLLFFLRYKVHLKLVSIKNKQNQK